MRRPSVVQPRWHPCCISCLNSISLHPGMESQLQSGNRLMTTLSNPSGVCASRLWENTAAPCASAVGDSLHQVGRGVALGLIGLTVVLSVFASLIAITELRSDATPTILPTQIRLR